MIIVTGAVVARPDSLGALTEAALAHVRRSRAEPGCVSHAVHVDAENPLRLFFFERWSDLAALKTHFAQPGSAAFMGAVRTLSASSETIEILDATPAAMG